MVDHKKYLKEFIDRATELLEQNPTEEEAEGGFYITSLLILFLISYQGQRSVTGVS